MSFLLSALAFLILLTVLVIIHELGHFAAARKAGVTVEEFGFGLPPRVRTLFRQGGTRFSLNWIPFGGFVRLKGEGALTERQRQAPGSFGSVGIPWRIAILVAGVCMNFAFALLLFTYGFSAGRWIPTYVSLEDFRSAAARGEISMEPAVLINHLVPGGAAEAAGLPVPSILLGVDGVPVMSPEEVPPLQRGKAVVIYRLLAGADFSEERTVTLQTLDGKTGVSLQDYIRDLRSPRRSIVEGFLFSLRETKVMTVESVLGFGRLIGSLLVRQQVPAGITGIVGIAQITHSTVQEGFAMYLQLMARLSLSLAILNILPIPALDGGRLLFVLIEATTRRPMNRRFEIVTNTVGFALLLLLILVITYHDVLRLF